MISGFKKHPNLHKMNKKFINSFITNITDHLYHVGDIIISDGEYSERKMINLLWEQEQSRYTQPGGEASYLIHTDIYLIFVVFTV